MKTICKTADEQTSFIIADLEPAYHDAARTLAYREVEEGFAKTFPADSPRLDHIYQNFVRHVEEIILQMARVRPIPWEEALLNFLQIVAGQDIFWHLGGSAALAVRGLDVAPRDIDLIADDAGAQRLADLMLPYLVEPLQDTSGWVCKWFCRAFWGVRIEWIGEPNENAEQPELLDFGPTALTRLETMRWRGYDILVPPLDLQLKTCESRGLTERTALIRQIVNQ